MASDDLLAELRGPTRSELAAIQADEALLQAELAILDVEITEICSRRVAEVNGRAYAARQQQMAERLTTQLLRMAPKTRLARCWPDDEPSGRTA